MTDRTDPVSASGTRTRIETLDMLRGAALFGVLLANLEMMFRVPAFEHWIRPGAGSGLDQAIRMVLFGAIHVKTLMLFTMLLGFGLAMQFDSLAARGRGAGMLYRRMLALLAFGLVHLFLFWNGDILTEYALAGLLFIPMLHLRLRGLIVALCACLALYILLPMVFRPFRLPPLAALSAHVDAAAAAYGRGDYLTVLSFRIDEILRFGPLHLYQLPRTLATLLLGAMLWRLGAVRIFTNPDRRVALAGLFLTAAGFALCLLPGKIGALANASIGSMLVALGYAALFAWLARQRHVRPFLGWSSAVGRMAFTNYLLYSLVLGFLFYGYGLGLMGRISTSTGILIGSGIYVLFAVVSILWLRRHAFGPFEWVWRGMTHGFRPG